MGMLASMLAKAKHAREVVHAVGREQHKRQRHRHKRDDRDAGLAPDKADNRVNLRSCNRFSFSKQEQRFVTDGANR